jgi:hypothetical protein
MPQDQMKKRAAGGGKGKGKWKGCTAADSAVKKSSNATTSKRKQGIKAAAAVQVKGKGRGKGKGKNGKGTLDATPKAKVKPVKKVDTTPDKLTDYAVLKKRAHSVAYHAIRSVAIKEGKWNAAARLRAQTAGKAAALQFDNDFDEDDAEDVD